MFKDYRTFLRVGSIIAIPVKMMKLAAILATLFPLAINASGHSFQLTILHTNDVHARFEQMNKYGGQCSNKDGADGKCFGGVARRMTKLKELRKTEKNVLLLDAGDEYQGTFWFYFLKGEGAATFMNKLKYDAMALGNHEFDLGVPGIIPFIRNVSFPVLSCNIDASKEPVLAGLFKKSVVVERGGEKIGIVGYTIASTPFISNPGDKLKFLDEVKELQKEVDKLTRQGINKIIALGHSGYDVDQKIAKNVRGIDVIVGGHSNTFLYTGKQPSQEAVEGKYPTVITQASGDKVLIVQDYAFAKYLGRLNVWFDGRGRVTSWTGNPILLDKQTKEDPDITKELQKIKAQMDKRIFGQIGKTAVYLNGSRELCRHMECNLGNMMADAMVRRNLAHPDSLHWATAAIGLWNSGGIRYSLKKGPITTALLLSVAPFQNTIDIIKINGSTLWQILEHSVSALDIEHGRFLQVSGLVVTYNIKKPVGQRVVSVKVMCGECSVPVFEPLEKARAYMVIITAFIIRGGDFYSMIKPNIIEHHVIGDLDTDVLVEYVAARSPIFQGEEERIRFVEDEKPAPTCRPAAVAAGHRAALDKPLVFLLTWLAFGVFR